jgi:hypothetical protein
MPFVVGDIVLIVWLPSIAALGVASTAIETVATSVGAGIVLGGFLAGTARLLNPGRAAPEQVVEPGYMGGWIAFLAVVADAAVELLR